MATKASPKKQPRRKPAPEWLTRGTVTFTDEPIHMGRLHEAVKRIVRAIERAA